jgi:hypothetical protein
MTPSRRGTGSTEVADWVQKQCNTEEGPENRRPLVEVSQLQASSSERSSRVDRP